MERWTFVADTDHMLDWSVCSNTLALDPLVFSTEQQPSMLKRLANVKVIMVTYLVSFLLSACFVLFSILNTKNVTQRELKFFDHSCQ